MQHDHHQHPSDVEPATPRPPKQEQLEASTEVTEVAPGVLRTQLPISLPGLGHVNCYVLEDERGFAVVDPGLPGPESWDHLVDRLARAGCAVADVHTVVVTHSHPDHFGGAMRLHHEAGAEIVTHESFRTIFDTAELDDHEDSEQLDVNSPDDRAAAMERYFAKPSPWGGRRAGPSPEFMRRIRDAGGTTGSFFTTPRPTHPLEDGQTIKLARREWVAMHTPGHTYDHLCLHDPEFGVVITGDMAESETYAHLEHLRERGELERHFEGGIARYTLAG